MCRVTLPPCGKPTLLGTVWTASSHRCSGNPKHISHQPHITMGKFHITVSILTLPWGRPQRISAHYGLLRWKHHSEASYLLQRTGLMLNAHIASIHRHDRSILTERQSTHESWMGQSHPQLHSIVEPCVMHHMDISGRPFPVELLAEALTELSQSGSPKHRLLALESLDYASHMKDGHQRATQSYWGIVHRHGDFTSNELTVACFLLQVIEFGDSAPLHVSLMGITGYVENVERHQCVISHFGIMYFWGESGRSKRVPVRGRISTAVQEIRAIELPIALFSTEASKFGSSLEGVIAKSNARDVRNPAHVRDFRTLGSRLSSALLDLVGGRLRIFDIGRGTNGYDVSVHLFANNSSDNGTNYIDLISRRHHMRRRILVEDTRPNDLLDWHSFFSSAAHYAVLRWSEFAHHPTETDAISPTPCLYCKRKVDIPADSLLSKQRVSADDDESLRKQRVPAG